MNTDVLQQGVIDNLIETLEDGRLGFQQAADTLAETDPNLASRLRELGAERERFSAELRETASRQGYSVSEEGSVAGAAHRGWITLKEALASNDRLAVLGAAETGEDHAVANFESALESELSGEVRAVVVKQMNAIRKAHDEVRSLRDGAAR
jgi:uncharacterized protein (TIGR02284 family)